MRPSLAVSGDDEIVIGTPKLTGKEMAMSGGLTRPLLRLYLHYLQTNP
jgi:hypothetical protein